MCDSSEEGERSRKGVKEDKRSRVDVHSDDSGDSHCDVIDSIGCIKPPPEPSLVDTRSEEVLHLTTIKIPLADMRHEDIVSSEEDDVLVSEPMWLPRKKSDTVDVTPFQPNAYESPVGSPGSAASFTKTRRRSSAKISVSKDSDVYNMSHPRRGRAIIFNQEEFDGDLNLETRKGSRVDRDRMKIQLERLGFEVACYDNPDLGTIIEVLAKAKDEDHSDADCFVVVVLTHGDKGTLNAKDMAYPVYSIWKPFTSDKCPTLAGKPKIFFIQACRGKETDAGTLLEADYGETKADSGPKSYSIPSHADFLIAFSTVEGFYSWRNPDEGTWFIQCLCHELAEQGTILDLLTLMTRVCRRVALDYESFNKKKQEMHEKKQVPSIVSMLTRDIYFSPKHYEASRTIHKNQEDGGTDS